VLLVHAAVTTARAASAVLSARITTLNGSRRPLSYGFAMQPDEELWQRFLAATRGQPAWGRLMKAASMFAAPGDALDVGAGAGRDTAYLLEHGWRVTAVDSSPAAVKVLRGLGPEDRLRVVHAKAQEFAPETYDLVNAQFVLPFVPPREFAAALSRLQGSVRPGGVMAVTFFGPRDEWNASGTDMTFTTKDEAEGLFAGWHLLELSEIEEDGTTATGGSKHWDVIHVIALK
jgi:tellurite methyltransferase